MKLNDEYVLKVIDILDTGAPISKINLNDNSKKDIIIFLDKGVIGDLVKCKITKIKKNYLEGKVIDILEKSSIRNEEKICTIENFCGGCQILNIKYEEQLKIKKNLVIEKLKRIGNIEYPNVKNVVGMEYPYRYRNKVQIPLKFDKEKGEIIGGFYKIKSHEIVPFEDCKIQSNVNNKILELVKKFILKENIMVYDESTGKGNIRHIITKISNFNKEIMLVLVTNSKQKLNVDYLIQEFKLNNIKVSTIVQNINSKKTNVIMGKKNITLSGCGYITDKIENLSFRIYPNSFFQINYIQMVKMYNKAIEYGDLKGNEIVFDLFCGIGTISLLFSKKAKKVYGIEVVEESIKSANENKKDNNIENVEFILGKVEDKIKKLVEKSEKPDVIILDPARKGVDESALKVILEANPKKIIYISCNPSTLARDLKILTENTDYKLKEVTPFDLFCHSMHIENVCLISK